MANKLNSSSATPWVTPERLHIIARLAGGIVMLVSALVLIGWMPDISALRQILLGWPMMAPLTAVDFLIAGAALAFLFAGERRVSSRVIYVAAVLVGLSSGVRLCVSLFGWRSDFEMIGFQRGDLPVDTIASMAPATAFSFLLLSVAFFFSKASRSIGVFQLLVMGAVLLSWLGLARYLYGGEPLLPYLAMSAITASCFLLLSVGILCSRTDGGLVGLLSSDSVGGTQARRLLLPALIIPSVLALLVLEGYRADWFGTEAGLTIFASSSIALFTGFIWANATLLHRSDFKRRQTQTLLEASFKEINDLKTALDEHAIVAVTDPRGRITHANDKFCAISGFSLEELLGKDHRIINSGFHSKEFFQDLWTTISEGRVWRGEFRNKAKDGSFYWVDATIVPFLAKSGRPRQYVAIRTDITMRKRVEAEVRELNVKLEQRVAERTAELEAANKELEAFSYSVSHDLRAPLRAVSGFAGILMEDFGSQLPEEARQHLKRIFGGTQRMGILIDDILKFSRLGSQPLKRQIVNTLNLVQTALQETEAERKGRPIDVRLGELPPCAADPALLKQVWINLLSNAIKYTRGRDPAVLEIGCDRANGESVFYVRDNGAGFDMKYSDKLFGVFQRLHSADEFEGTGVGLAIAQRIIRRHGGRIWAEAEVDRGATFFLTIKEATEE